MATAAIAELRKKSDAVWDNLSRQLQGMEPHLDLASECLATSRRGNMGTKGGVCAFNAILNLYFQPDRVFFQPPE